MENEELIAKITELTNLVKDNKGLQGLKQEELIADFEALLTKQQQAILEAVPVRKGEIIPETRAVDNYKGRYKNIVKGADRHAKGLDLYLAKLVMDKAVAAGIPDAKHPSSDLVEAVKAMTATGSATGDEIVPTNMAASLWEDFFAASKIAADLPNIPMPSDPFDAGLGLGNPTWRKGTENTATTASDLATAKSTLTATEQVAEVNWSYNLDEDAVVAMMPAVRAQLAQSGGEQMDAFCINADSTDAGTGNINLDDADPAVDSYYLSSGQDGMRHQWIVDNTAMDVAAGGDALTDADMVDMLQLLGKYGLDYNNCRIVPEIKSYFSMLGLTNVATVDKYGTSATIVKGELARYQGVPVIPSASMPLTEADGKCSTTAGSNTLGQIMAYNRNMWAVGYRRGLTIEVDRLIQKRQLVMVVSFRIAIGSHGTRSTNYHTSGILNILL